jgi:hypothetical protein
MVEKHDEVAKLVRVQDVFNGSVEHWDLYLMFRAVRTPIYAVIATQICCLSRCVGYSFATDAFLLGLGGLARHHLSRDLND